MNNTVVTRSAKAASLSLFFSLLLLLVTFDQAQGATVQLCPLLSSGGTVNLSSANTYQIANQCWLSKSVTINGSGATVSGTGPIGSTTAGVTITVDYLIFTSSGWGALAVLNGSQIIVRNNSSISCPGGTGVDAETGSTITMQNSSISSSTYGVQIKTGSTANLHGVTITGTPYAVQADGVGASVTVDQNSLLEYPVSGTAGIGILNGASGVVHDTTIRGFLNGVDVEAIPRNLSTPSGTVDIQNCTFDTNGGSSMSAWHAQNVRFANSTVLNAQMDGIYLYHSTGVIDKSQVIGSLNSGVSFEACPDGATIQNSLVKNNAHQGINVVECEAFPCPAPVTPSLNIKVLNNTLANNQLANILVTQNYSTAGTLPVQMQGNIFTQTPQSGIYLGIPNMSTGGPQGITIDSALVTGSTRGMEIKSSSQPYLVLSDITENNANGILIYENSSLTAEQSLFWNNGLADGSGSSNSFSIFVDSGAHIYTRSCAFGPAGTWALFNKSTTLCDVTWNYWDAPDGPNVANWSWLLPPGVSNGSGAFLGSNYEPVIYTSLSSPSLLTQPPVSSSINENVSLSSGGTLTWDSQLGPTGPTIGLTANPGSTALTNETLGVMKVYDTPNMNLITPPANLSTGQLYVVWISTPLRFNSASGYLQFSLPFLNSPILNRRGSDGSWTTLTSQWNRSSQVLTYAPTDPHLLNGTFAITENPDLVVYAKCDGTCNGEAPCYSTIQNGANSLQADTIMYATQETFGSVTYNSSSALTISGGWNPTYTTVSNDTTITGSLTIISGTLILENVTIQ